MNAHALAVLELPGVLALVAERASSGAGAERVRALLPTDDRVALGAEHARLAAMRSLVASDVGWSMEPIPTLGAALGRLRVEGVAWTAPELLAGGILLRSSRRTRETLRDAKRAPVAVAMLAALAARLVMDRAVESSVERAIDDDGEVRDEASPALRRIRRELRGAEGELVRLLERYMARLESHQQVPDMSVTLRNGRYVIPIRREARATVGGIVHDTSSTGATLFVEPPAAIEAGNRIRELETEEVREVDRILRELTGAFRPLHVDLADSLDALVELDTLYARARFAIDFRCAPAELASPGEGFVVRDGRHPLLLARAEPVVPFDLEMLPGERTLLVSGPNTGGKTVLLKALGLVSALIQCGVSAPVGPESRVAVFDDMFADVGDEQSIEASLSTFSAHLRNLSEILQRATANSLVLIDELGSGTDPVEGAALGGAILEELTRRGTQTVATTHLGALKELATEVPGVVNASLQFDAVQLAPTYRLIKGVPGRSYGLSIARRLALPADVLARAEERLPRTERDVEALLAELERRSEALRERETVAAEITEDGRARAARLAERELHVRARERELERAARLETRRYLLDARAEIERTIAGLRSVGGDAMDDTIRDARRAAERLAGEQGAALEDLERDDATTPEAPVAEAPVAGPATTPRAGEWVELTTLGDRRGRLLEMRGSDGVVSIGGVKMTLPFATLRRAREQAPAAVVVPMMGDLPDVSAPSEIDLRGLRVGEIDDLLMQAIDAAVRADLRSVRIIHGKGTGALRERVTEMLRKETRVKSHRMGAFNEGGTGVTVVELR